MTGEHDTTLGALQTAIRMEIDGKEFYQKAGKASRNELGKKLLERLAVEEDGHRMVFEGIYKSIGAKKGWPEKAFTADRGRGLKTVFAEAMEAMDRNVQPAGTELDAIQTGMTMENKTYDYYKSRSRVAAYTAEKQFYEEVAMQEEEHYRILMDYYEFLKNPADWFLRKERHSLDGG